MLAEWDAAGGVDYHLSTAQGAAQGVLDAMPVEDKAGFQNGFDALPQAAQTAIITELALSPGGAVRVANAENCSASPAPPKALSWCRSGEVARSAR